MFSRTLQTSGQNVYCHTEGLSAALNFDWENKTKKQKKKMPFSTTLSFVTSGYVGNCSPGKLPSEELVGGAEERGRENSPGKAGIQLWFP